jgi:hypothetical protein
MKICLSRFGFIGIVDQDFQSWKDKTIIGWFTTIKMIRNILIISLIAALVPTAMSNVSPSADAEIALFSGASVDTDSLSITGNGDSAKMELKATNDDGKSNRISDFQLTADNVLSTEVGDKVTVKDNVDFTKAVTTDARDNQKAIGITSNGVIDFAGYTQGVYTLDVVVDDDRAYEAIIAIGDQTNQIVDKEITRVNSEYTIWVKYPPNKDPECKEGEELIDDKCQPVPIPCPEGEELIDGKCQEPKPPVDPCGCPIGEDCPAEACVDPDPCTTDPTSPACETPEPITPDPITPDPGDPVDPCTIESTDCETPEEPVVLPLVGENTVEVPNEPIKAFPNYEELGEGSDDSEGDEDSGSDDSEDSEDSGGSDSEGSEDSGGSDGETSE